MADSGWATAFLARNALACVRRRDPGGKETLERMKQCTQGGSESGVAADSSGSRRASWAFFEDTPIEVIVVHPADGRRIAVSVSAFVPISRIRALVAPQLELDGRPFLFVRGSDFVDCEDLLAIDLVKSQHESTSLTIVCGPAPALAFPEAPASRGILVSPAGPTVLTWVDATPSKSSRGPRWSAVRASVALPKAGRFSWATRLERGGQLMLGIARSDAGHPSADAATPRYHNQEGRAHLLFTTGCTLYPGCRPILPAQGATRPRPVPRARRGSTIVLSWDAATRVLGAEIDGQATGPVADLSSDAGGPDDVWHPVWEAQAGLVVTLGITESG